MTDPAAAMVASTSRKRRNREMAPLSETFRQEPVWWSGRTLPDPLTSTAALPREAETVVVGGGFTGVSAARELARRGREVVVLESGTFGQGASTRNGGIVRAGLKTSLGALIRRHGDLGKELYATTIEAQRFLEAVIAEEALDCDYRRSGFIKLAHSSSSAARLRALVDTYRSALPDHAPTFLTADELRSEIDTREYVGGLLDHAGATIQPAKYFGGLFDAAMRAGAGLFADSTAVRIEESNKGAVVRTNRGVVHARHVLIATDGYTGSVYAPLARRVIPISSYVIATTPLAEDLATSLFPSRRAFSDTRNFVHYWQRSSDGRLVFGGRASFARMSLWQAIDVLYERMVRIFPRLRGIEIEYAWEGKVGYTRDHLPHIGRRGSITYAVGYCGAGVSMATFFGAQAAAWIAGGERPVFSRLGFPAVPLYSGRPWFLPLVGPYYQARDRFG